NAVASGPQPTRLPLIQDPTLPRLGSDFIQHWPIRIELNLQDTVSFVWFEVKLPFRSNNTQLPVAPFPKSIGLEPDCRSEIRVDPIASFQVSRPDRATRDPFLRL